MDTPSSARRQALRQISDSNQVQVRKEIALSKYYSIAKRLLDSFTVAFDSRSLDEAYIYGVRFVSLCVQSIPQHPSYRHRSYAIQHKEISDKCNHVLECLEIVRQRMDAEEILREQQRQLVLKQEAERQRAEEAELEARRQQQQEESERHEATKTKTSALAKLSAMQRDLNQPTTNLDLSTAEMKESAPTKENQPKKTGLIRAQVNFGGEDSSSIQETPSEQANETAKDTANSSSFMGSAMSKMASMVSRTTKKKETSETTPSEGTNGLIPAQIMDSASTSIKSQPDNPTKSESKIQRNKEPEKNKMAKKEALEEKTIASIPTAKLITKPKKSKPSIQASTSEPKALNSQQQKVEPLAISETKTSTKLSAKKPIESSKKNVPVQADKSSVEPKPSKQESTTKAETPDLHKKEVPQPVKQQGVPKIDAPAPKTSAPQKDQEVQPKADVPPTVESSAMEVDKVQEDTLDRKVEEYAQEPVAPHTRRPEEGTIELLEKSIGAQLTRIEEIEQKLIPKLLEQARNEHQIAKTAKISKQERMLHKRKAIHCMSQKRKWEKLAETTKIAVFHMETQIFRLENALEDQQVQEAMSEAKTVIQSMGNSVGVDDLQGFSEAVGAGELVKTGVDGEDDEIMIEELESWIGSSSTNDKEEETLDEGDLSILSLPNIPQNELVSPSSSRNQDRVSKKKLVHAAV